MKHSDFITLVGREISIRRGLKNMTQAQLAERLGVKNVTVSDYELGKVDFPITRFLKIAEALECNPMDLFKISEPLPETGQAVRRDLRSEAKLNQMRAEISVYLSGIRLFAKQAREALGRENTYQLKDRKKKKKIEVQS